MTTRHFWLCRFKKTNVVWEVSLWILNFCSLEASQKCSRSCSEIKGNLNSWQFYKPFFGFLIWESLGIGFISLSSFLCLESCVVVCAVCCSSSLPLFIWQASKWGLICLVRLEIRKNKIFWYSLQSIDKRLIQYITVSPALYLIHSFRPCLPTFLSFRATVAAVLTDTAI